MPREGDGGIAAGQIRLLARERKEDRSGGNAGRAATSAPPPIPPPTNPVLEPAPLQACPIPYSATGFTALPSAPAIKRMDTGDPSNPSPLSSDPPIHSRSSISQRIVVKFPRRHDSQHFILQDITGSKIEAISYRDNVQRFDTLLQQGSTYTLYGVAFYVSWGPYLFRNFGHRLELTLAIRTVVEPFHLPIQFPPYPKHLMPFHEVLQQPHKRFIDVIGIVIHLAPLEHIGGRSYREAILMDSSNSALHDPKSEECFNQQLSREETGLSGNSGTRCVV
ncbi:hypothetical protein ZEAMMB73_Zm00001d011701 [Zea mays]|uniref:Uncharacterized protein n=1 Tax=Zea mays TaxID=4577 RepID=A0A1D6G354_MAIZE|nr:hypothetical protein ZEAMMB73_Zm00001d011701 [Zea mays]